MMPINILLDESADHPLALLLLLTAGSSSVPIAGRSGERLLILDVPLSCCSCFESVGRCLISTFEEVVILLLNDNYTCVAIG